MSVKPADLNAAFAKLIADQVAAAIAPYRAVLDRMATLLGAAPAPRAARAAAPAPKTEPKKRRTRRVGKRGSAAKRVAAPAAPANYEVGQKVMYRRGRGAVEVEAKVFDFVGDALKLERTKNGVRVKQPATKVIT